MYINDDRKKSGGLRVPKNIQIRMTTYAGGFTINFDGRLRGEKNREIVPHSDHILRKVLSIFPNVMWQFQRRKKYHPR